MLDKHTYLWYGYDWSWWSWWSRWTHNIVAILSWFTLFQQHYKWKSHLVSATLHIGSLERIKPTQSHLRSWVTLLPFWTLCMIKKQTTNNKTSVNDFKQKMLKLHSNFRKCRRVKHRCSTIPSPLKAQMGLRSFIGLMFKIIWQCSQKANENTPYN